MPGFNFLQKFLKQVINVQAENQASTSDRTNQNSLANYIPTLDGWRAIAITLVILAHICDALIESGFFALTATTVAKMKELGLLGVKVFFALSGLLITTRLLAEEKKIGRITLRKFYIRRAFRIFPASLAFLVTVGAMAYVGILNIDPARWLGTVLFAANYLTVPSSWYVGHFWSLAVEEHFYLFYPLALLLLKFTNRRLMVVIALAIAVAVWRFVDFKFGITGSPPTVFWGRTDIQVDGILWGAAIGLFYSDPLLRPKIESVVSRPKMLWLILGPLIAIHFLPTMNWKIEFMLLTVKAALLPVLLLCTASQQNGLVSLFLETALLRWIGRLSYSIYLWQQLFLVWSPFRESSMHVLQRFPNNLIALGVCASLSYYLIEKPMTNIGHRLAVRFK